MHSGDPDTLLAEHADDFVMFDVPPSDDGVQDIAAYGETWPPFFAWRSFAAVPPTSSSGIPRTAFGRPSGSASKTAGAW